MKLNRRHLYSAWLALLAMLMISVAPVVSQAVAMAHVPAGHEAAMSGHAHGDSAPVDHSDHGLDECGYCTLLTQLPALGDCSGPVLNAALLHGEPLQHGSSNHQAIKVNFPDALPRAPPSLIGNDTSLPGA